MKKLTAAIILIIILGGCDLPESFKPGFAKHNRGPCPTLSCMCDRRGLRKVGR